MKGRGNVDEMPGSKAAAAPRELRISADLSLPLDAVTETFAILAKRGKGKTHTGAVLVEELVAAAQQVVVIDPVGVWWGLRSSAAGDTSGLPVVILGGDHGDLPIEPGAGALVAETVVATGVSMVLDLSTLSKAAGRRFVTGFLETLYHRNRAPMTVVIDECDQFAPQRATGDVARCLGAVDDVCRRGRARGIGVVLISQRPAVISKDVLSQVEVLIVMGMTSPRDVAAIDEWVRLNADDEESSVVRASLASLAVGTAWVWSPSWLALLRKVQIRPRHTFDSSSTPKPGQTRRGVSTMAPVDIASLGQQMQDLAQDLEAGDPEQLRRRIRELEAKATTPQRTAPTVRVERIVERVVPEEIRTALAAAVELLDRVEVVAREAETVARVAKELQHVAKDLQKRLTVATDVSDQIDRKVLSGSATATPAPDPPARGRERTPRPPAAADRAASPGDGLPKAQRLVLSVLATYGTRTVASVAILAGYSSKGGGFRNALSALRTAGLITGRGDLSITEAGRAALGPVDELPTGDRLRAHWKGHGAIPLAAGRILDVLADHYPDAVPLENLAAATGYESSGGGFRNAVSRLRSLGLAHGRGELVLDEALF